MRAYVRRVARVPHVLGAGERRPPVIAYDPAKLRHAHSFGGVLLGLAAVRPGAARARPTPRHRKSSLAYGRAPAPLWGRGGSQPQAAIMLHAAMHFAHESAHALHWAWCASCFRHSASQVAQISAQTFA